MRLRKDRNGKYVLDYLDQHGVRHQPTFATKAEREQYITTQLPKIKQLDPTIDAKMTVESYVIRVLATIKDTVEPATFAGYESVARMHIIKEHGDLEMRAVDRPAVYRFLASRLQSHSRNTVRRIQQVYQVVFDWAIEEKLHGGPNPVKGLVKKLKLVPNRKVMAKNIKAMDVPQLDRFLETCLVKAGDLFPLFVFMVRNGFRPGEAYGAQVARLSLDAATYYVDAALCSFDNEMGGVKTDGSEGTVCISPQTVKVLEVHLGQLPVGSRFLFPSGTGKPHDHRTVNRRMKRILQLAGLPMHFTPHCLRHTYASQSLAAGESLLFVQQQLRHASVTLTADLYGSWLPKKRTLAAGALDNKLGVAA